MPLDRLAATDARPILEQARAVIDAALVQAGPVEVVRAMDLVAEVLGVSAPSETAATVYATILGELPADLLQTATDKLLRTHRWEKFPRPADWMQHVEDALARRRSLRQRIQRASGRQSVAQRLHPESGRDVQKSTVTASRIAKIVSQTVKKL